MVEKGLTVGQYLQRQREAKKISLESVARITRITLAHLQAIERDEFHRLPAEIFIRGVIRSYANFIQLDPAQIMNNYQLQVAAQRNFLQEDKPAPPPSFLKNIRIFLTDLAATILGAAPAFSPGKIPFSPKD